MPSKSPPNLPKQELAARVIQRAWKSFLNVAVFQHFKSLIDLRRQGEPRQIVKYINPKEFWTPFENEMLESAKESEFHFSKLKRKQDMEKKRKIKKIEWMREMYYLGSREPKAMEH